FRRIQLRDLRAGFADAELGAEIDLQHVSGLARFGKHPRVDDAAYAQFDHAEVVPGYRFHALPPNTHTIDVRRVRVEPWRHSGRRAAVIRHPSGQASPIRRSTWIPGPGLRPAPERRRVTERNAHADD